MSNIRTIVERLRTSPSTDWPDDFIGLHMEAAAEIERLRAGIRKAVAELGGVHQPDPEIKGSGGCVVCWPDDGSWPCLSAMAVDDLRALIGDDQ